MLRGFTIILLVLGLTGLAQAEVYKRVKPDGTVEYSDKPLDGSELIKLPKSSGFRLPPVSGHVPRSSQPPPASAGKATYESVKIVYPNNDQAIRANTGNITVVVEIKPGLQKNHRIAWYLDGEQYDVTRTLQNEFKNIDRGTHTLKVEILDGAGKTLIASEPVTFHLQRYVIPRGSSLKEPQPPVPITQPVPPIPDSEPQPSLPSWPRPPQPPSPPKPPRPPPGAESSSP